MSNYKTVNEISDIDAAYIAGLIDGDGSILLSSRHKNDNRQLVVSISNNDNELLTSIQEIIGAGHITSKRTTSENHSPNFTYAVSNRQAVSLLEQITKYLKTYKYKRAKLILESYIDVTPRNGKYTKELVQRRDKFIETFFALR